MPTDDANAAASASAGMGDDVDSVFQSISAKFDKLEALGPSLLEVLTLVTPPQPKSQRSGQDTTEEGGAIEHELPAAGAATPMPATPFPVSLTRSMLLARLVDPSMDNTRKLQELFASTLETLQCEATGVVLVQEGSVLLFLETTADQFLAIARRMTTQSAWAGVVHVASLKVLASCDDLPTRLLQGLYFRKIVIPRAASDASEWHDEALRQLAVDTFLHAIKFIKRIGALPPAEIRKALTTLSNTDQVLLPSNALVLWLVAQEEGIMTLHEFRELYDSPIALELEEERTWPVHPLMQY